MAKGSKPKVEAFIKKVGDEPYIAELIHVYFGPSTLQWRNTQEAAEYIVDGDIEWIHIGGKIHAGINAGSTNLPYNSCGFAGDFLIVSMSASGKIGVMSQSDKRRIFKWYEKNKNYQPLKKTKIKNLSPEEFQKHSENILKEQDERNTEWKKL